MFKHFPTAGSCRIALFASVGLAALLAGSPSFAQETAVAQTVDDCLDANADGVCDSSTNADGSDSSGGQIVVTGSRIPRPEFDGTIPGSQISQEQIESRSFTNTLEVLNDIPLVGPGASQFGTNGGQPASLGAAFVDLLDLGTQRTLTLVNGRRYVSGNAATLFVAANATGSQVDLNTIPTALIRNLDVLTVGGAVAYGSDAVAGVVNAVLRDDFEGVQITGLSGLTDRGDGGLYRITGIAGMNFGDGRGNITASIEYNHDDALLGDKREGIRTNFVAPTSFRNGARRNSAFTPSLTIDVAAGQGAFLPAASDLVPNNIAGSGFPGGSILLTFNGAIFQSNANIAGFAPANFQGIATTDPQSPTLSPSFRPQVLINQAGNTNLVPGTPIATGNGCAVTNLTTFCNFAPSALPGTAGTAARTTFTNAVITRFAPTITGGTAAQRDALALQLLQANIQTPREFLARNPNANVNAFIGTTIPNFLDIANPDPATSGVLPRVAVPLQFDAAGNVINPIVARISDPAVTPSTTGGAVNPDAGAFLNPAAYTILRVEQDRTIGNLLGHYDLTPGITLYTENQFARVISRSPRNLASSNTIGAATAENAALVFDITNPFLDAADRAALTAAGVTSKFVLSRQNQDIVGDNPAVVRSDTYRTVVGAKGEFGLLEQRWFWDASFTYGQADARGQSFQIKDIEYALALDAVDEGLVRNGVANGNIVCRAQVTPAAYLGRTPQGVNGLELVRVRQPDGTFVEQLIRKVVTQDQISACRPLNPFGYNQMSAASKEYVLARTGFENTSKQYFALATLGGTLFDLPGGPLGVAISGEYRREEIAYKPDALSAVGGTRTAALAETEGYIDAMEFSAEARIPVFGDDFNIPLFRNLDLTPGVRFVKQDGAAPDVRLLNGSVLDQTSTGEWNTIYSLAGTWRPIKPLLLRGNYTRSIRQPSVTELFLGGQPAFTGVTDPCASANIGAGLVPATRRANCQAAVIAAGLATDATSANAFLNSYVPSGANISGTFSGSPGLSPERGESYTFGGVFEPRDLIPGLRIAADYINVKVRDQIIPTTIVTALQLCYDSPTFPDTSAQVGVNACSFFNRIPSTAAERRFEVDNGFNSGFINLGTLQVKAINGTVEYGTDLSGLFGEGAGRFEFFGNVYHLMDYLSAPDGNLANAQQSAGTFARPEWELQLRGRYENGGFFGQWTWNWQDATRVFSGGVPVAGTNDENELQDLIANPAFGIHDATIGYTFGDDERFRLQFTVRNVFDKLIAGPFERVYGLNQGRVDDFGRRFVLSASAKF